MMMTWLWARPQNAALPLLPQPATGHVVVEAATAAAAAAAVGVPLHAGSQLGYFLLGARSQPSWTTAPPPRGPWGQRRTAVLHAACLWCHDPGGRLARRHSRWVRPRLQGWAMPPPPSRARGSSCTAAWAPASVRRGAAARARAARGAPTRRWWRRRPRACCSRACANARSRPRGRSKRGEGRQR